LGEAKSKEDQTFSFFVFFTFFFFFVVVFAAFGVWLLLEGS